MKRQANKKDEMESDEMPKKSGKKPFKSYKAKIKARVGKKSPLKRAERY